MTIFSLGSASVLKYITSYQVARWDFRNLFVTFGIPEMIVVDADGLLSGMFKKKIPRDITDPSTCCGKEQP